MYLKEFPRGKKKKKKEEKLQSDILKGKDSYL